MPKFLEKLPGPGDCGTDSLKFMLSALSLNNSATKEETCRAKLGGSAPKTVFCSRWVSLVHNLG
jgi:hypothetical protein